MEKNMAALIVPFIAALPSLFAAGEALEGFIVSMKTTLSQDAAWTADVDAQWQAALIAAGKSPEWLG
jgi:hypothetical protein